MEPTQNPDPAEPLLANEPDRPPMTRPLRPSKSGNPGKVQKKPRGTTVRRAISDSPAVPEAHELTCIQRPVSLYGKFRPIHSCRNIVESSLSAKFPRVQRGLSSNRESKSRSIKVPDGGGTSNGKLAEQELGPIRGAWSSANEFCFHRVRQRCE
jgi:hypothetical protein